VSLLLQGAVPCPPARRDLARGLQLAISTKGKRVPFHVRIDPAKSNGLRETTFVKCEQILTIAKARLTGKSPLGRISDQPVFLKVS
jgi:mRNA-degrading endonuclease toxin of MazEF toxin-antitoxin module